MRGLTAPVHSMNGSPPAVKNELSRPASIPVDLTLWTLELLLGFGVECPIGFQAALYRYPGHPRHPSNKRGENAGVSLPTTFGRNPPGLPQEQRKGFGGMDASRLAIKLQGA